MNKKMFIVLLVLVLGLLSAPTDAAAAVELEGEKTVEKTKIKKERGMSGIVFFRTRKLKELKAFYLEQVGCGLWMDQADCLIFKFGNMLFGFCRGDKADLDALITFFYEDKSDVDRAYDKFKKVAKSPPVINKKYNIYHFFAHDPEGRAIEFQYFAGPIDWDFHLYR